MLAHARENPTGEVARFDARDGLRAALPGEVAQQLVKQKRVAAGRVQRGSNERAVVASGEFGDRLRSQRTWTQDLRRRVADQRSERRVSFDVGRARRHHERHGKIIQAPREVVQRAHRALIGPVRIINRENERPALGEVGQQPVQPMQHRLLAAGHDTRLDDCRTMPSRTGEDLLALDANQISERARQCLAHDTQGKPTLKLSAARVQDLHSVISGATPKRPHQPCLADAGRSLDHKQTALTATSLSKTTVKSRQLPLALDQPWQGRRTEHRGGKSRVAPVATQPTVAQSDGMTNNTNIQLARRAIAAFEAADEDAVDELIHPCYRDHAGNNTGGQEGARQTMRWLRDTFADTTIVPQDLIASDDRVVARVRFSATQIGDLYNVPATGKRLEAEHVHIWRVADGQLAEHWMVRDDVTAMQQLGALPAGR